MHSHGEIWAARSETAVVFRQHYCFSDIISLLELTDSSKVGKTFLVDYDRTKFGRVQKYCEGLCLQQTEPHNSGAAR